MIGREGRNEDQLGNGKESSPLKMAISAGPKAAENYLEMARDHGFEWVDISGSSPGNFPENFDPARVKALRNSLEEYSLGCGIHTASYVNTAEIFGPIRQGVVQHFRDFTDLACGLGARYLIIHCGVYFRQFLPLVEESLIRTLQEATAYAEKRKIPLLIENMNRIPQALAGKPWELSFEPPEISYLGITAEELAEIFKKVNSPILGFSLNVAHANLLKGGVPPFLRALADKLGNVQISDNNGITDDHLPIGEGTVDFVALMRQLKRMNYQGTLSLSVAKDRVLECRDRLQKILDSAA
jgi:fructoselysine 3-epimerase